MIKRKTLLLITLYPPSIPLPSCVTLDEGVKFLFTSFQHECHRKIDQEDI